MDISYLTQDELKVLVGLLHQLSFKLPDAVIVNPIAEKLKSFIKEEEKAVEGTPPDAN